MDYDKLCDTMQPAYTAKQSTEYALIHNQNDILLEFEFSFDTRISCCISMNTAYKSVAQR